MSVCVAVSPQTHVSHVSTFLPVFQICVFSLVSLLSVFYLFCVFFLRVFSIFPFFVFFHNHLQLCLDLFFVVVHPFLWPPPLSPSSSHLLFFSFSPSDLLFFFLVFPGMALPLFYPLRSL